MTPEKQRVVIAEACGWQRCYVNSDEFYGLNPNRIYTIMPNYPFSLNAMHDAEKVLWDKGLLLEFVNQLVGIVCAAKGFRLDKLTTDDHLIFVATATAEQEAEAFLRVLGLWEEAL